MSALRGSAISYRDADLIVLGVARIAALVSLAILLTRRFVQSQGRRLYARSRVAFGWG